MSTLEHALLAAAVSTCLAPGIYSAVAASIREVIHWKGLAGASVEAAVSGFLEGLILALMPSSSPSHEPSHALLLLLFPGLLFREPPRPYLLRLLIAVGASVALGFAASRLLPISHTCGILIGAGVAAACAASTASRSSPPPRLRA